MKNVETKTGPATCPTCRRAKYLIVKRRYQQSRRGQATARAREDQDEVREKRRQFSASERGKANNEKYRQTRRGKATERKKSANYRARLHDAEGVVTAEDWLEILEQHNHRCYYCHKRTLRMTLDHVIPLSKGGRNSPENVVPACHRCNCKKRDKLIRLC